MGASGALPSARGTTMADAASPSSIRKIKVVANAVKIRRTATTKKLSSNENDEVGRLYGEEDD